MLGTALRACVPYGVAMAGVDLEDGDLARPGTARRLLGEHSPDVVLHCAAWTDVDGCTRDPDRAMLQNGQATAWLAEACALGGVRLVYMSTDYVFPGDAGRGYAETDAPRPLNPYGVSKLAGEEAVAVVDNHAIVRTQWLFGPCGRNFVATIVSAASTRDELRVVADEYGSPTYTLDLAPALWGVALDDVKGILHLTGGGVCSWYDLAKEALAAADSRVAVHPVSSADWGSVTARPRFSALATERGRSLGHRPLRPWQQAVREYVSEHLRQGDAAAGGA